MLHRRAALSRRRGDGLYQSEHEFLSAVDPGYEAPISAVYSLGNRSAAIRIPKYANQPGTARFEFRLRMRPRTPTWQWSAQLLAGMDGIRKGMDPTAWGLARWTRIS